MGNDDGCLGVSLRFQRAEYFGLGICINCR